MGGGKSGGGEQTVTQKNEPWAKTNPYLLGNQEKKLKSGVTPIYSNSGGSSGIKDTMLAGYQNMLNTNGNSDPTLYEFINSLPGNTGGQLMNPDSDYEMVGNKGIFDLAQDNYNKSGWTSGMQGLTDDFYNRIAGVDVSGNANDLIGKINAGDFDANLSQVGQLSLPALRAAQGELNPTDALKRLLSGEVDMNTYQPIADHMTQTVNQNLNENMLASNRSTAIGSGGYGSSRQGIADALSTQRANQELSGALSQMYGTAYDGAQNRMYSTANALDDRGVSVGQTNAQIQQWNNQNELARQAQRLQAALSGQDLANNALSGLTNQYNQLMSMQNAGNDHDWANLNNYANLIYPAAGFGGSSTQSQPLYQNSGAGAAGGALAGLGLMGSLGGSAGIGATAAALGMGTGATAGLGAGAGALLGLLSDRRFKKDIKRVGTTDQGVPVYTYQYTGDAPVADNMKGITMMGVMADEVKQINPDAVIAINGVDHVYYGRVQ